MSGIIYKINKLLEAKTIKKQVFADKIGISRDTVYNWTDENIKVSTLLKVSSVLGVSINHFLSDDKNIVSERLQKLRIDFFIVCEVINYASHDQ